MFRIRNACTSMKIEVRTLNEDWGCTLYKGAHFTPKNTAGANASLSNSQNRLRVHLHSEVWASAQTHNIGVEQCEGELTPQPGREAAVGITGLG